MINKGLEMNQTNKQQIANPINKLSYDKTSAISIFEYSKGLLGRSLREFIKENYSRKGKAVSDRWLRTYIFFWKPTTIQKQIFHLLTWN